MNSHHESGAEEDRVIGHRSTVPVLIERLEKAAGPDRELDADIAIATGILPIINLSWMGGPARFLEPSKWVNARNGYLRHPDYEHASQSREYTASIDAALTLVPEGAGLQLERHWLRRPEPAWQASLFIGGIPGNPARQFHAFDAYTPAIALCIAALKAREALA